MYKINQGWGEGGDGTDEYTMWDNTMCPTSLSGSNVQNEQQVLVKVLRILHIREYLKNCMFGV